jgi:hypothetical protein
VAEQAPKQRAGAKPFDLNWLKGDFASMIDTLSLSEREKHFLRSRWLEYVLWMESAAQRTRLRYYVLRGVTLVGAVVVPALVSLNVIGSAKTAVLWIAFAVSLVVGLCAALEGFFRLGERWRHYRRRAEELKAEGWDLYQLAGRYQSAADHSEAFPAFVANIQGILALEVEEFLADIASAAESQKTESKQPQGKQPQGKQPQDTDQQGDDG